MSAEFTCGSALDACRCQYTGPVPLSPAGMKRRHTEAVKRAARSDRIAAARARETQRRAA
jgi:hypothetical protein